MQRHSWGNKIQTKMERKKRDLWYITNQKKFPHMMPRKNAVAYLQHLKERNSAHLNISWCTKHPAINTGRMRNNFRIDFANKTRNRGENEDENRKHGPRNQTKNEWNRRNSNGNIDFIYFWKNRKEKASWSWKRKKKKSVSTVRKPLRRNRRKSRHRFCSKRASWRRRRQRCKRKHSRKSKKSPWLIKPCD